MDDLVPVMRQNAAVLVPGSDEPFRRPRSKVISEIPVARSLSLRRLV